MEYNLEQTLRDCAPEVPMRDEHRQNLRTVLLSAQKVRRRNIPALLVSLACLAGLLVVLLGPVNLGSGGFELIQSSPRSPGGGPIYVPATDEEFGIGGRDLLNVDACGARQKAERLWELSMSGTGELIDVTGWTIGQETKFLANYSFDIDGEKTRLLMDPDFPASTKTEVFNQFVDSQDFIPFFKILASGHADYLGTENRFIDGTPVQFDKWSAELPQWGKIVYWRSHPIP